MFLVHEEMLSHPKWEKIEAAGARAWADAIAVWVSAGLDCRLRQVDGIISRARLEKITPLGRKAVPVAERLADVGLFDRTEDGYQFHDWDHVQETREEIRQRRAKWRELKKAGGKGGTFHSGIHGGIHNGNSAESAQTPLGVSEDSRAPIPTPDPDPSNAAAASSKTDQETRAKVKAQLLETNELSPDDVYAAWHVAAPPGVLHQIAGWRGHYATIAAVINGHPKVRPVNRKRVLEKLCQWVWRAPEGPHGSGKLRQVTPAPIAKFCGEELDRAMSSAWVESRFEQPAEVTDVAS